jgi:uncharacterized protein
MDEWICRQLIERQLPLGRSPVMFQRWCHLLFLHWPLEPQTIQSTLPSGLEVDTFAGQGWIGIVPFFMRGVRPAGLPSVVGLSNFLELNLRTYVRDRDGRPGIWFYSLDANQPLAVWAARFCFALPYQHAAMRANIDRGDIAYSSVRFGSTEALDYRYRPVLDLEEAGLGSLEFFLLERYRLFAHRHARLLTGRVYHAPYRLGKAIVHELDSRLFALDGFEIPSEPPAHAAYVRRVDVSIYPIEQAGRTF